VAYAFLATSLAIHGVVAWVSPLQGDDWTHWGWSKAHAHLGAGDWIVELASSHFTSSDLIGFVLAHSTLIHTILTPLAGLALLAGMFVIAARRLPRLDSWNDVTLLVVLSALIWIAAPRLGFTWFHRSYTASWIYGAAASLWLLAPYRCRWQPRGLGIAGIFILGLAAGSASRQLGAMTVVGVVYAIYHAPQPRARWLWIGLAGVVIGTIAGYLDLPAIDFKSTKTGFILSMTEGGELLALVLGLGMLKLLLGRLRPAWGGDEALPDTDETLRWFWVWLGLTLLALLGPTDLETTLFPVSVALCIAAVPYVVWFMTSRPLRLITSGIAVGIHGVVWTLALAHYIPLGAEFRERVAKLESAPAGSVALVEPYSMVMPGYWFYGEDWYEIPTRQLVAIEVFGLRAIEFSSKFRSLEVNPGLELRLETEGVTPAELVAARAPAYWGTNLGTARSQFQDLIDHLEDVATGPFSARLVVVGFDLEVLRGRRLFAATYERGRPTIPEIKRKLPDEDSVQLIRIRPAGVLRGFSESYVVVAGRATPTTWVRGYAVKAMTTDLHSVVTCKPEHCVLVDAFVPNL
jgi:hypothetical protein